MLDRISWVSFNICYFWRACWLNIFSILHYNLISIHLLYRQPWGEWRLGWPYKWNELTAVAWFWNELTAVAWFWRFRPTATHRKEIWNSKCLLINLMTLLTSGQLWDFYRPETQWQAVTRDKCQISIHFTSRVLGSSPFQPRAVTLSIQCPEMLRFIVIRVPSTEIIIFGTPGLTHRSKMKNKTQEP